MSDFAVGVGNRDIKTPARGSLGDGDACTIKDFHSLE